MKAKAKAEAKNNIETRPEQAGPRGVAIVGMSCMYPGAPDLGSFWSNIVRGVDATREVSDNEWSVADYYDPRGRSNGLSYSKRGGFITEYSDFDPLKFGIMPSAVEGSDADQFLTLKVAVAAMADAGYEMSHTDKSFDRDRAEIIIGRISAPGAGSINLIQQSKSVHEIGAILSAVLPDQSAETIDTIVKQVQSRLTTCTADNTPGAMPNVLVGRLAAKLGFRGRNLLIDAACASSMVAVETAVNDLLDGRCDFALAGGVHINSSAVFFQMFSILGALSPRDVIAPYDQEADGTLLGEGIGILCLKRYEDAVADGNRIYATIRAAASSSDGHGSGVLAPSAEGEALAMRRAYEIAGISPSTVQLLEGHGTGTPVGDVVELEAVAKVFHDGNPAQAPWCAIGSVKSMIGHCQSASAVAGIIKASLALHHKVLPATLNVTKPNSKIDWAKHPCYINTQTRPWITAKDSVEPRRAAVSAFGFGGINGHMILEEFTPPAPVEAVTAKSTDYSSSLAKSKSQSKSKSKLKGHSKSGAQPQIDPQASIDAQPSPDAQASPYAQAQLEAKSQSSGVEIATNASSSVDSPPGRLHDESLMHDFDSEVFTFVSPTGEELQRTLSTVFRYVEANPAASLKDLAYTVNCVLSNDFSSTLNGGEPEDGGTASGVYRLALVASSQADLATKLLHCLALISGESKIPDKDIYLSRPGTIIGGKLAFLYPGLGSAYTNMLADLCMHFPEVREVFEIVDMVALSAGATEPPSKSIFPPPFDKGLRAVPTLLAAADFAVVAVLLAEYAMYQLLIHLGIKPDVIMGCSTGEFAAITTTGSVDVLSVAKTFYQLSTRVARSIPAESLANLRTLRVLSSWEKVSSLTTDKIYLSADLGDNHIIVTGSTEVVTALSEKLKEARIGSHLLPVPIPYHTPLVASIIDANNAAVKAVDIQPLTTPGWSCSTSKMYPQEVEAMRASFVELFTKPIALRQTVQAMHEDGVRIFVEVGPNGILTSSMAGILADRQHVAVASNLASRSGVSQIHHLLAILHTQGIPANLSYLYKRRKPRALDLTQSAPEEKRGGKKLSVIHAPLKVDVATLPESVRHPQAPSDSQMSRAKPNVDDDEWKGLEVGGLEPEDGEGEVAYSDDPDFEPADGAVLQSFLNTNASFYSRLNSLTEHVMQSYIQGTGESSEEIESNNDFAELPFLKKARISYHGDATMVLFNLDLSTHLYLHDHAIGGLVSTVDETKVHLVPLMVTLEIMAEAALAHIQSGVPVRVEQVKAFRRIVVDKRGLTLRARVTDDGEKVRVELNDGADESTIFATADFVFADCYPGDQSPPPQLTLGEGAPPIRLADAKDLYGDLPLTMFHGPRMQSVVAIDQVGNRAISGRAGAWAALGWTPGGDEATFLLHPLLLDNSSQFVLFYLYENSLSATALLPFLIESIEFFEQPQELPDNVTVTAVLPTLSERATEANLEVMADDQVVIKINGINSRRVILSEQWENLVNDPVASYISSPVALNDQLADAGVIMLAEQSILPEDDVILDWCLDYLLTRTEQTVWRDTAKTKKRRVDWLLGRIAAKEAVRKLIQKACGRALGPHDVEIVNQEGGAPLVRIADAKLPEVLISISHTDKVAVALAVLAGASKPGIDAEVVREHEPSFASTFLKPHELSYLANCPKESINNELTKFWSVKEALYKASGGAFEMSSFALATERPGSDVMEMTGGQPARQTKAYVSTRSDLVIAYVI